MGKKHIKRRVTIIFSGKEYSTLKLLATKLNISVPEVVRGLVPRFSAPITQKDWELEDTEESDLINSYHRILKGYSKERIKKICNELITNKKGSTLAIEIMTQLIEDDLPRETLTRTTEKRLIRWAHPARVDKRTRFVTPRAREICEILFGYIPERIEAYGFRRQRIL